MATVNIFGKAHRLLGTFGDEVEFRVAHDEDDSGSPVAVVLDTDGDVHEFSRYCWLTAEEVTQLRDALNGVLGDSLPTPNVTVKVKVFVDGVKVSSTG